MLVYELTHKETGPIKSDFIQTNVPPPFHLKYGFNERLLDKQNSIKSLDAQKFRNAKTLVNMYEFIGKKVTAKTLTDFNTRFPMKISRAYYKMLEILCTLKLTKDTGPVSALCLCEGPGGFISAILDYYKDNVSSVIGVTLPESNGVPGFQNSETDNVNVVYSDLLKFDYDCLPANSKFDIVTADGGFEFTDQECIQEQLSSKLVYAEVIWALKYLAPGGSFILKVFSLYSQASFDILRILSKSFARVIISKPKTSRPCNNEKYLLCLGFRDDFPGLQLPNSDNNQFIQRILTPVSNDRTLESQLLDANCLFSGMTYKALNKAFYLTKKSEPVTVTDNHIAATNEMAELFSVILN